MPQLQFGPNLTTAGINVDFPITALNQQDVIGFDFQNFSPFPLRLHGTPGLMDYHLWPFQGVYIPVPINALLLEVAQQYYPTSQTTFTSGLIAKNTLMHLFFRGDQEPESPYVPYPLLPAPLLELAQNLMLPLVNLSASQGNSSSAHVNKLGPFTVLNPLGGSGLWLTHLSYFFGIPGTQAAGDLTLVDAAGTTWGTYHMNTGTTAPEFKDVINFDPPLKSGVSAGNVSFEFDNPAMTNGPGYSVNLVGIYIQN